MCAVAAKFSDSTEEYWWEWAQSYSRPQSDLTRICGFSAYIKLCFPILVDFFGKKVNTVMLYK